MSVCQVWTRRLRVKSSMARSRRVLIRRRSAETSMSRLTWSNRNAIEVKMTTRKQAAGHSVREGQVAIVTGASSGIGLGITRALLEHGFRVVANSRAISKSKDLKSSADLVLLDGDIGKKETAIRAADAAMKHFGRIDLLVNNAGIYMPKPFTEYTPQDFEID